MLGKTSSAINKKAPKQLPYDHTDKDWGVTATAPVDYSKAKFDLNKILEPGQNVDVEDVPKELARQKAEEEKKANNEETIELTTS